MATKVYRLVRTTKDGRTLTFGRLTWQTKEEAEAKLSIVNGPNNGWDSAWRIQSADVQVWEDES